MRNFHISEEEKTRVQIRKAIGRRLGADCHAVVREPLPERFLELLRRLAEHDRKPAGPEEDVR